MPFMLIETKTAIQQHKHIIFDILSSNLSLGKVDDHPTFMFIDFEYADLNYDDLFINLAEELYSDLRVYVSQVNPRYEKDVILSWFQLIPFQGSVIYDDSKLLLKRMDYPIDQYTKRPLVINKETHHAVAPDTVGIGVEFDFAKLAPHKQDF